jgi:NAD(P)-dependent dehydrogenase (short-subunit alcohol dehydrogenase family)
MSKQVVLITGALTGIGRATALAYAKEGAQIVVSGRNEEKGFALAKELRALGAEAEFQQADVRKDADVQILVEKTLKRFGRLDVAVNNAGTEGTPGPVVDQTVETYQAIFDTNVLGVILSMKHEMRAMAKQKSGSIINISSSLGQRGTAGASVYVASKFAVEGLTKSAALEGAPLGVRVNIVAPGATDTAMLSRFTGNDAAVKEGFVSAIPIKRMAKPDEIAQTIIFVGSDKAPYMTGHSLVVDGGFLL